MTNKKKELGRLLKGLTYTCRKAIDGISITSIAADSRKAAPGSLFVAIPGLTVDGHDFVGDAVARGCAAIVVNQGRRLGVKGLNVPIVEVVDTKLILAYIAAAYYDNPAEKLTLIGITGTNGKTTLTYLLESILKECGINPGVIGTVSYRYQDKETAAPLTTPEPMELQSLFRQMVDNGVTHVLMEVSSHALFQKRLHGLMFDLAMFTNLSRDHLDFHGTMENYYASKKRLFTDHLKRRGKVVIIRQSCRKGAGEDPQQAMDWGSRLMADLALCKSSKSNKFSILSCGLDCGDVRATNYSSGIAGISSKVVTPVGTTAIKTSLVGEFNLANILGAFGAGVALGLDLEKIGRGVERVSGVPGRLQRITGKYGPVVFVDYAHTPDALESVLKTLRLLTTARVIAVFGCGGDRDKGKRPLMGEAAGRLADVVLATSDNPRSESPEQILKEIETGLIDSQTPRMRAELLLKGQQRGYDIVVSRKEAIRTAIRYARNDDLVLISGKGHETYQISRAGRHFFDDRLEARKALDAISW